MNEQSKLSPISHKGQECKNRCCEDKEFFTDEKVKKGGDQDASVLSIDLSGI